MSNILLSIKPEYVCKILNKEKILEIRKSMPKCELPCKVYIYCTKSRDNGGSGWVKGMLLGYDCYRRIRFCNYLHEEDKFNGKVVAEFTLNNVDEFKVFENGSVQYWNNYDLEKSCLTYDEISNYIGKNKDGYAWHIDNLKIYDTPKELNTFVIGKVALDCGYGNYNIYNKILTSPPKSWCYVE